MLSIVYPFLQHRDVASGGTPWLAIAFTGLVLVAVAISAWMALVRIRRDEAAEAQVTPLAVPKAA